jgi:hypothetical protein
MSTGLAGLRREMRNVLRFSVEILEDKRSLGRLRAMKENNINWLLKKLEWHHCG